MLNKSEPDTFHFHFLRSEFVTSSEIGVPNGLLFTVVNPSASQEICGGMCCNSLSAFCRKVVGTVARSLLAREFGVLFKPRQAAPCSDLKVKYIFLSLQDTLRLSHFLSRYCSLECNAYHCQVGSFCPVKQILVWL